MAKNSEDGSSPTEEESPENSSSGEDNEGDGDTDSDDCSDPKDDGAILSEYEKQRLSRIADNKARMDALGLNKIASSLKSNNNNKNSVRNRKGKRKVGEDDDEDYMPNNDHGDGAEDDDDDDLLCIETSRNQKVNKKSPKGKKAGVQKQLNSLDFIDGRDEELMQAIALSLQDSPNGGASKRKGKTSALEDKRSSRKKPFASRVQMAEDDVILHFFQFDEAGKGNITVRDLERVAIANDFIWTEEELTDMISCFDSDGDGKLNLGDFQKIIGRLNMVRGSDNSPQV